MHSTDRPAGPPRVLLGLIAFLLLWPAAGSAQDASLLPLGIRVRLRTEAAGQQVSAAGRLVSLTGDSIAIFDTRHGRQRAFLLSRLTDLAVSRGRHSRTGRGALIGLVGGAAAGVATAFILCRGEDCESSGGEWEGLIALVLGVGGGLAGTGVGALIGSMIRVERWEEVPLSRIRLTLQPLPDRRFGAAFSVWF